MIVMILGMLLCAAAGAAVKDVDTRLYCEKYRPQYHFTPAHRWSGDPCGTLRHHGKYLAYSWGAATSEDLLYWTELNGHAIKGVPDGISTFTGSVVADVRNTSGHGPDALVAVFTSADEHTRKQSQSIAFSHDGGTTFQYYGLNPVLDIWSTEFRDPTVFWDDKAARWVMLVAKALEKKVAFYASSDLMHWEWLSDFGPMGDSERSWECPDMFRLPVENSGERKWILVVSVNWAREQYFIGEWDGTRFVPDHADAAPQYVDEGLDFYASRTFRDFDNPDTEDVYSIGWVNSWDYATAAPSEWGKGIWSIPRKLSLCQTDGIVRLCQRPAPQIEGLRQPPYDISLHPAPGVTALEKVSGMGNVYELKIRMTSTVPDVAGLNLCVGDGRKLTISVDTSSRYLTVDRTNTTDASIPKFERIAYTRLKDRSDMIELDLFVDRSTVEIFTDAGKTVLTLLTYPSETQTGAELFTHRGTTHIRLTAYPLTPTVPPRQLKTLKNRQHQKKIPKKFGSFKKTH